ncbi:MAG: hypothetical protein KAR06_04155 [Deltaproteobacteria bacterium]|nr:hypothetical protein [Deltaproteobacteria bacterium]
MPEEESKQAPVATFSETMQDNPELARVIFYGLKLPPNIRVYAAAHLGASIMSQVEEESRDGALDNFKKLTKEISTTFAEGAKRNQVTPCVLCGEAMALPEESKAVEICPACIMKGTGL